MADNQSQSQKEYNSLLGLTQSMLGKITDAMSDLDKQTDKRNKKLSEQISLTRDILKSVENEKDLQAAINLIRQQNKNIAKEDFGVNNKLKDTFTQQQAAIEGVAKKLEAQQKIFGRVDSIVDELKDKFTSVLDGFDSKLKGIPIIGGVLSEMFTPFKKKAERVINVVAGRFTSNFKSAFIKSQAAGDGLAMSVGKGLTSGLASGYKWLNVLTGGFAPLILAAAAFGAALYIGLKRFQELDAAAKSFRTSTGLLNSQTTGLRDNIKTISTDFAGLGVNAEDVAKSAADFTNEFGGLEQPSKAVLGSMVTLNKNFGIGTQEASKLNKVFQNIGGLTAEQSQALIGQTVQMAKMVGVAPDKVIKDMADNSEYAYRYFQGSPEKLRDAAVQAAKLGTSLKEAGKVADTLLDFESSITSELEASAILGTNINLSQSRYLASTGDIVGAQQAVIDQTMKLGDLTKLNKWQQDALVAATGMEFESLVNQQRIRERFGTLNKEQLASAMSLVSAGKDISKMTTDDLNAQTDRLKSQQEMQSLLESMGNQLSSLKTAFMDMFEPFASFILPVLGDVVSIVVGILGPALRGLGSAVGFILSPLKGVYDVFRALVVDGPGAMVDKLKEMGPAMSFIVGLVGTLALIWVATILPSVISTVASLAVGLIGALVTAIPLIISMAVGFITSAIAAISTMSALTLGIGAIAIVGGIALASAAANSSVNEASANVEGSIGDGVVQDGKIVSTDPADFLIATKNPSELANSMGGGGTSIDMSGVIAELQSLKEAFLSNKDVYMNGEKVTAVVRRESNRTSDNQFGTQYA